MFVLEIGPNKQDYFVSFAGRSDKSFHGEERGEESVGPLAPTRPSENESILHKKLRCSSGIIYKCSQRSMILKPDYCEELSRRRFCFFKIWYHGINPLA